MSIGVERDPRNSDKDYLYIDDRNDGGCKADKFERDERLLRAELAAEPDKSADTFLFGADM